MSCISPIVFSLIGVRESTIRNEELTIVSDNTIPDLANIPIDDTVKLDINGHTEDSASAGAFSQSARSLTWSEANAGYVLDSGDRVIATYNILKA